MERKTILFVAEAVTLAHVGRPLALAQLLDRERFDIQFACADGYDFCFKDSGFTRRRIDSIPSARFLQALADGKPVYDEATLLRYVDDDVRLLKEVRPDAVVGDFRLSLSVSARLARLPYVALINAYWSPYVRQHYAVPNIPLTRALPIPLANALFGLIRPLAFAAHTVPLNRVRRRHGLASLGTDLRRVYTDADHTAYADHAELFPAHALPASHSYLGPVIWSPPLATPEWWNSVPQDKPVLYITLGSSGQGTLLPLLLRALATLPVTVMAATAGNIELDKVPPNAFVAPFLPGSEAAQRASIVVCNGGSPTSQQALATGTPVLGIASNLDQFLNMHGIAAAGAGMLLRADRLNEAQVRVAVEAMLNDAGMAAAAKRIAQLFAACEPGARLAAVLERTQSSAAA
ncbi:glycosyltransferase [Janthinobacterium fluminis]|uniref:Glycosyltransferase n=1 Tax=Janthinobacterium fluminis TaxID=2987524 RepID=A0ABT5JTX0_9BURK|nr:glycosyltransferase [Janthinobacterium fluminis]MDC8756182.1 glycosyltransferase [Janthinobacterium fluminis]